MNNMKSAPKDGSNILLKHYIRHYDNGNWSIIGTMWEECRWISNEKETGSKPHWEPWCGNSRIFTTDHIQEEDAIKWLPVPI